MRSSAPGIGSSFQPPATPMDLATNYLGLKLKTPFIVGASPFCDNVNIARRLEEAGAGAVVMRSLFEEQIDPPIEAGQLTIAGIAEEMTAFPDYAEYQLSPKEYLRQIERLKRALSIPVVASLNGHKPGGWTSFARAIEWAGADAIEVNFYQIVADPGIAADQIETEMLETVGLIAGAVRIPVAVKLSPFHASVTQLAVALELEGAAGIVLFNRFYQPDINSDELEVQSLLQLSDPQELLLRLRWLAILSPQLRGSLAATGGIHTPTGALKALLAGAHAVQVVSVLLRHGPRVMAPLVAGVQTWMEQRGYTSIEDFRGSLNLSRCHDPSAFERANYIRTLQTWKV
jgi:dihydroorotate dehydrogenase (fumarate)